MSKYELLKRYLLGLRTEEVRATFAEIEAILGFTLPMSARLYPAWWANEQSGSHSHARSWLDAGWKTADLDLASEKIRFFRGNSICRRKESRTQTTTSKDETSPCLWDSAELVTLRLGMKWEPIGEVVLDANGRLKFPRTKELPSLYRFRIRQSGAEFSYVGETENLRRRLYHYRNPGPSQQTNLRINDFLAAALRRGAEISLSVVSSGAWIDRSQGTEKVEFAEKTLRRLFENLALAGC